LNPSRFSSCPELTIPPSSARPFRLSGNKAVRPRPLAATSIPGMLTLFQDEWDALMLETHQVKTHLDTVRQELVKTLYQHDAACRVIARVVAERDEARFMLQQVQAQAQQQAAAAAAAPAAADSMDVDESGGVPKAVEAAMQAKFEELQKGRKGRKAPDTLASVEDLAAYEESGCHPLHSTTKKGVTCVAVDPKDDSTIVTGGQDGGVIVFDKSSGKVGKTIKAHSKAVTSVVAHSSSPVIFSTSADKVVKMWSGSVADGFDKGVAIKTHTGEVTGLSLHPTGDYIVTSSMDGSWAFTDIGGAAPKTLMTVTDDSVTDGYSCLSFHPDGLLCGVGSAKGVVQIFDVRKQAAVASLPEHTDRVLSVAFSENGYYLATGGADGQAICWDLRKLQKNNGCIKKLDVGASCSSVCFDYSGSYLAVAADDIKCVPLSRPVSGTAFSRCAEDHELRSSHATQCNTTSAQQSATSYSLAYAYLVAAVCAV
jgi:pre-mRNA-processing factor 19